MKAAMKRIVLGGKIDFKLGMQIVRKTRAGEIVVTLQENGFLYDGQHWPSLSAAAQAAAKSMRSGNDYFSLKAGCTEVRSASGKVIASKHKLEES